MLGAVWLMRESSTSFDDLDRLRYADSPPSYPMAIGASYLEDICQPVRCGFRWILAESTANASLDMMWCPTKKPWN